MTPEGALLKQILDYLAAERIWAMRINTGAVVSEYKGRTRFHRYGRPGCADILAFPKIKRRSGSDDWFLEPILWIECKTPKGKQSEMQKVFQGEVEAEGHTYIVARSLEDVKAALQ